MVFVNFNILRKMISQIHFNEPIKKQNFNELIEVYIERESFDIGVALHTKT
jgi:hypothetical protein